MCVDYKQKQNRQCRTSKLSLIILICLALFLIGFDLSLLPTSVDKTFPGTARSGQSNQSFSGEHLYHPGTHAWTFVED